MDRLEAVTARLEALEARLSGTSPPPPRPPAAAPAAAAPAAPGGSGGDSIKAFDLLLSEFGSKVEAGSKGLGAPDVEKMVAALKDALVAQRAMIVVASQNKKPSPADMQKALQPTADALGKIEGLKDRRSKHFNHLSMVAEGAACLQWVCMEEKPGAYLADAMPGSEMYGNKILMEFKGKDEAHTNFAKDFKAFLQDLQKYVKVHHMACLTWNPSGGTNYTPAAGGAPPPPPPGGAGGPPPPPPPPPAGFFDDVNKAGAGKVSGTAALFAELEAKGQAAAAGLRKVSKDQMTHKNPALRASNVVSAGAVKSSAGGAGAATPAAAAKKPPKMENMGNKWFIENFEGRDDLTLEDVTPRTAVLFVKNKQSLIQIPSKINTLSIDSCTKCRVLVGSCVASVEIINCQSVQIQVTGTTPMITMDGCAGVIVYLSQQCIDDDVAIVSSKCSEMNVVLPGKTEEEDPTEIPVPEQFETKIKNGKLETTALSHVGA